MTIIWPCDTCGARGVKNVCARGYCSRHLTELYDHFDPAVFILNGVGLQYGRLYPEIGADMAMLQCNHCGATWVGIPGDKCQWCRRKRERCEADLDGAA